MTRAQKARLEREQLSRKEDTRDPCIPAESRSGQPRIAEILRKPSDYLELKFISGNKLSKRKVAYEKECLSYEESTQSIYINLNYISQYSRDEFADLLSDFCNE